MAFWCYLLASALGAVIVLYCLLEIHYFLRIILCVFLARFVKKKTHILDTTTVTGMCLTTDVDTFFNHMNNARYFREIDFARVDFYERTKLYRTIVEKGGSVVQGASTIRYRRFIRPFTFFKITSKIIYWDDQSVFMEHRFISLKDDFLHCIAICRQRIVNCSAEDVMSTLLSSNTKINNASSVTLGPPEDANAISPVLADSLNYMENGYSTTNFNGSEGNGSKLKPEMPLDIQKWMEYNEISSKNIRNGC